MYYLKNAAYFVTHNYLNPIQKGVQSIHCLGEMIGKDFQDERKNILLRWSVGYKRVIMLNGGNGTSFVDLYNNIHDCCDRLNLPFSHFFENDLGGIMTAFMFVHIKPYFFERTEHYNKLEEIISSLHTAR